MFLRVDAGLMLDCRVTAPTARRNDRSQILYLTRRLALANLSSVHLSFVITEPRARVSRESFLQRRRDFTGFDRDPLGFIGFKSGGN